MEVKSVNILGQRYSVSTKAPRDLSPEQQEMYFGQCDREKGKIWLQSKLNTEHKYRTLFHEMGHACFYRSGVSFSGMIPIEMEEIIVETFASMQYEFLRDFLKKAAKGNLVEDISEIIKN